MDVKLRIIPKPKPKTRAVLEPKVGEVLPVIKGQGSLNLLCGNCGAVLVEGIKGGQIRNNNRSPTGHVFKHLHWRGIFLRYV